MQFLAQRNTMPQEYKIACGGGGGFVGTGKIPYSFLIGADGKVAWQGSGTAGSKDIETAMKAVKKPTAEDLKARADKTLAWADSLASAKRHLQAWETLERLTKNRAYAGTEAATKASGKMREMESDAAVKAEFDAQRKVARLIGGTERPPEKFKGKDRDVLALKLEGLAKDLEKAGNAPGALELTKFWSKMMQDEGK